MVRYLPEVADAFQGYQAAMAQGAAMASGFQGYLEDEAKWWAAGLAAGACIGKVVDLVDDLADARRAAKAAKGAGKAATRANATRGWKVGDPINNLTKKGNVPKWDAVRKRYWKNQGHYNAKNYKPKDLKRMRKGLAPQRLNSKTGRWESMELHHNPARRKGGLFDFQSMWPNKHSQVDPFRHVGNK